MKFKRLARRLGFHILSLVAVLAARGGHQRICKWGCHLGHLDHRLRSGLRKRLERDLANLGKTLGHTELAEQYQTISKESYVVNNRALMEVLALYRSSLPLDFIGPSISFEAIDRLQELQTEKKGVILLGLHMGNGVAMAAKLNPTHGRPIHVVYRESNKVSAGFYQKGLARLGLTPINAASSDGGFRQMLKALKNGEMVMILMDQGQKSGGVPCAFLGKHLHLPQGPVELAKRTGAPILPVFLSGVSKTGWTFFFQSPLYMSSSLATEAGVCQLATLMEDHILKHPAWWSWHQRRWVKYPLTAMETGTY